MSRFKETHKVKEGDYYYAPHRGRWGIWEAHFVEGGARMDDFVMDFIDKKDAVDFVYKQNGWN